MFIAANVGFSGNFFPLVRPMYLLERHGFLVRVIFMLLSIAVSAVTNKYTVDADLVAPRATDVR